MPFNIADNVSTWFYSLLEEEFDALAIYDSREHTDESIETLMNERVEWATRYGSSDKRACIVNLNEKVCEYLEESGCSTILQDAIRHSIDYEFVWAHLADYIRDNLEEKDDEEEATCVECGETKTESWAWNTTPVKNAPVCGDCVHKRD